MSHKVSHEGWKISGGSHISFSNAVIVKVHDQDVTVIDYGSFDFESDSSSSVFSSEGDVLLNNAALKEEGVVSVEISLICPVCRGF